MINTHTAIEEYRLDNTGYYFELVDRGNTTEYWLYKEGYPLRVLMLEFNNNWNTLAEILEEISKTYDQDIEEYEQYIRNDL